MTSVTSDNLTCSYTKCTKSHDKLMLCKACKLVRYCSKECQRSHWPTHKRDCTYLKKSRRVTVLDGNSDERCQMKTSMRKG